MVLGACLHPSASLVFVNSRPVKLHGFMLAPSLRPTAWMLLSTARHLLPRSRSTSHRISLCRVVLARREDFPQAQSSLETSPDAVWPETKQALSTLRRVLRCRLDVSVFHLMQTMSDLGSREWSLPTVWVHVDVTTTDTDIHRAIDARSINRTRIS